jgi:hypothetical protein
MQYIIIIIIKNLKKKRFFMFCEMQNLPVVISEKPTTNPVPVGILTKYNLMEETFGENWAKIQADKLLSPSFCTIGN